ncbi:MAG TPA: hypothetical protein VFB82_11275 [Blastocatellia bacterium]|nr:hypothetical protein [Blastocatellia bacterium]
MGSRIFKRGNKLFAAGSIGLIIVALLHGLGNFAPPPADPALNAVVDAMRGYHFDLGLGMRPSLMDIDTSLSITMSIMLLFVGIQNLVTLRVAGDAGSLVRSLILVNSIFVGAMVMLFAVCRIPPPLVTLGVVEILFLLALFFPHKQPSG